MSVGPFNRTPRTSISRKTASNAYTMSDFLIEKHSRNGGSHIDNKSHDTSQVLPSHDTKRENVQESCTCCGLYRHLSGLIRGWPWGRRWVLAWIQTKGHEIFIRRLFATLLSFDCSHIGPMSSKEFVVSNWRELNMVLISQCLTLAGVFAQQLLTSLVRRFFLFIYRLKPGSLHPPEDEITQSLVSKKASVLTSTLGLNQLGSIFCTILAASTITHVLLQVVFRRPKKVKTRPGT